MVQPWEVRQGSLVAESRTAQDECAIGSPRPRFACEIARRAGACLPPTSMANTRPTSTTGPALPTPVIDGKTALGKQHRGKAARQWKQRCSAAGLHLFDRTTGLNVLLDEIPIPRFLWSRAPRQVSIALTNRCDLVCAHCYAPKSRDELRYDEVTRWLCELDANGALGVGFGGGEPTLYRNFVALCQYAARETRLSVSLTTHGHHIDETLAEKLRGSVHFIRVSMDGVGATYEAIRGRSFRELQARLKLVRSISRFGINIVVNERTLPDLDDAAAVASDLGASELLLLPQAPVRGQPGIGDHTLQGLRRWVEAYGGPLKLCINEASADGFPTCDPLPEERGLRALRTHRRGGRAQANLLPRERSADRQRRHAPRSGPSRSGTRGGRRMKIWYQHGSEHSANLVMIGHFEDATEATKAKEIIDALTKQVAEDQDKGTVVLGSPSEHYGKEMLDLLIRLNIGSQELEQFAYEVRVKVEGSDVVLTTDELDISAFLKVMFLRGARIEVYSAHDHPGTGHGRGQ